MATDIDRVIEVFKRQGWYPVPWAHHPPVIKEAIRAARFRPQIKQCFANCQRLIISWHPVTDELVYREGWIISVIPMLHAWLEYRGQRIDLTLDRADGEVTYLESLAYDKAAVAVSVLRNGVFGPLDGKRLREIDPLRAGWERLGVRP